MNKTSETGTPDRKPQNGQQPDTSASQGDANVGVAVKAQETTIGPDSPADQRPAAEQVDQWRAQQNTTAWDRSAIIDWAPGLYYITIPVHDRLPDADRRPDRAPLQFRADSDGNISHARPEVDVRPRSQQFYNRDEREQKMGRIARYIAANDLTEPESPYQWVNREAEDLAVQAGLKTAWESDGYRLADLTAGLAMCPARETVSAKLNELAAAIHFQLKDTDPESPNHDEQLRFADEIAAIVPASAELAKTLADHRGGGVLENPIVTDEPDGRLRIDLPSPWGRPLTYYADKKEITLWDETVMPPDPVVGEIWADPVVQEAAYKQIRVYAANRKLELESIPVPFPDSEGNEMVSDSEHKNFLEHDNRVYQTARIDDRLRDLGASHDDLALLQSGLSEEMAAMMASKAALRGLFAEKLDMRVQDLYATGRAAGPRNGEAGNTGVAYELSGDGHHYQEAVNTIRAWRVAETLMTAIAEHRGIALPPSEPRTPAAS